MPRYEQPIAAKSRPYGSIPKNRLTGTRLSLRTA